MSAITANSLSLASEQIVPSVLAVAGRKPTAVNSLRKVFRRSRSAADWVPTMQVTHTTVWQRLWPEKQYVKHLSACHDVEECSANSDCAHDTSRWWTLCHREFPADCYAQCLYFLDSWDGWDHRRRDNHTFRNFSRAKKIFPSPYKLCRDIKNNLNTLNVKNVCLTVNCISIMKFFLFRHKLYVALHFIIL